jgi:membrane protease YdiL (CAAX protease family)
MNANPTNLQTDVTRDPRRLLLYFGGLIVVYVAGVYLLQPTPENDNSQNWALIVMAAPTIGALLARFAGPGVIQWGRLSWWILAGLLPILAGLAGYWLAASLGIITAVPELITAALVGAWLTVPAAMISAAGEEIGWRGFLWPLVRRRLSFIPATLVVTAIWWIYHVPVVLLGWYGNAAGLPAFTVAIIGFGAFVGVLTDRSRAIWPSVVAHGGWNALVATAFVGGFTGSTPLIGEFGWVAAFSMLALGVVSVAWHLVAGGGARMPYLDKSETTDGAFVA